MIQLPHSVLPAATQTQLEEFQRAIDDIPLYADKVSAAKERFERYNRRSNATFKVIRSTLTSMLSGARRCGYCEDSYADEVEHVRPKDLYPELTFIWENYIYACGPCNGPKNNRFAVFNIGGVLIDITRRRGDPIIPPPAGDFVLIDPRRENALDFMELDLKDTFYFLPKGNPDSLVYERAKYSIDVLRLNERDLLPAARAEAYASYRARVMEYTRRRDEGALRGSLDRYIIALQRMGHPSVWHEMKRQGEIVPELHEIFELAPEALAW
jgi:hypothetical protein